MFGQEICRRSLVQRLLLRSRSFPAAAAAVAPATKIRFQKCQKYGSLIGTDTMPHLVCCQVHLQKQSVPPIWKWQRTVLRQGLPAWHAAFRESNAQRSHSHLHDYLRGKEASTFRKLSSFPPMHQHPYRWHLQYYRSQQQQPQLPQRQECAIALSYAVSAILHAASGFIITLNSKTQKWKAKPRRVACV